MHHMNVKGDKRRPAKTSVKEFDIRFDLAFGKKDKAEQDLKEHLQSAPNREQPK
jgi:hypothetical protein